MIGPLITRFATGLRYPTLFKLVGVLFIVDFFVPDMIPFFDEIVLALGTLLLGSLRKRGDSTVPQAGVRGTGDGVRPE